MTSASVTLRNRALCPRRDGAGLHVVEVVEVRGLDESAAKPTDGLDRDTPSMQPTIGRNTAAVDGVEHSGQCGGRHLEQCLIVGQLLATLPKRGKHGGHVVVCALVVSDDVLARDTDR